MGGQVYIRQSSIRGGVGVAPAARRNDGPLVGFSRQDGLGGYLHAASDADGFGYGGADYVLIETVGKRDDKVARRSSGLMQVRFCKYGHC